MYTHKSVGLSIIFVFVTTLALLIPTTRSLPTQAASLTVNTTTDELNADGDCSLREAIQAVNTRASVDACPAGTGNDTIILPAGTYTLNLAGGNENANATGDLDVFPFDSPGGTVTIQGAGPATTTIDGNAIDRVLHLIRSDSTLILRDVTVRNGRLTDQPGAGILSWGALELHHVVLENSVVNGTNDAAGGGLCIGFGASTGSGVLEQVVIRHNQADRGGGIFSNRPLTITATSIISNTARAGGGIINYGHLVLTNSTISSNTATVNDGGIAQSSGSLSILNSTISHNELGGVFSAATTTLKNTLIAQNAGGYGNCSGTMLTSLGHNLSSDNSCTTRFTAIGDLNNTDPRLGPLQDNGGPTPTRALLPGSPAINAGTNAGCPATDQRGISRPQGGTCDIGAFEGIFVYLYLPFILR